MVRMSIPVSTRVSQMSVTDIEVLEKQSGKAYRTAVRGRGACVVVDAWEVQL